MAFDFQSGKPITLPPAVGAPKGDFSFVSGQPVERRLPITPEREKPFGERALTFLGKVTGVERLGKGLGLAIFRHLTPEGRELERRIASGQATPEDYEAYAKIYEDIPTAQQLAGGALQTTTTLVGAGLPAAKTIGGVVRQAGALGAASGLATAIEEEKPPQEVVAQTLLSGFTSAALGAGAFGVGKIVKKYVGPAIKKTAEKVVQRLERATQKSLARGKTGVRALLDRKIWGSYGKILREVGDGIEADELAIQDALRRQSIVDHEEVSKLLNDVARKFESGLRKGPKRLPQKLKALIAQAPDSFDSLDDFQTWISERLTQREWNAAATSLNETVGELRKRMLVDMSKIYQEAIGTPQPDDKFIQQVANRVRLSRRQEVFDLMDKPELTYAELNNFRRLLDHEILGSRAYEGDAVSSAIRGSIKDLARVARNTVKRNTPTEPFFSDMSELINARKLLVNAAAKAEKKGLVGISDLAVALAIPGGKFDIPAIVARRAVMHPAVQSGFAIGLDQLADLIEKIPADAAGRISRESIILLIRMINQAGREPVRQPPPQSSLPATPLRP